MGFRKAPTPRWLKELDARIGFTPGRSGWDDPVMEAEVEEGIANDNPGLLDSADPVLRDGAESTDEELTMFLGELRAELADHGPTCFGVCCMGGRGR